MRKPESCTIVYCGFQSPQSFKEIQFEILGLKNIVKKTEERLSALEQSAFPANLAVTDEVDTLEEYFLDEKVKLIRFSIGLYMSSAYRCYPSIV